MAAWTVGGRHTGRQVAVRRGSDPRFGFSSRAPPPRAAAPRALRPRPAGDASLKPFPPLPLAPCFCEILTRQLQDATAGKVPRSARQWLSGGEETRSSGVCSAVTPHAWLLSGPEPLGCSGRGSSTVLCKASWAGVIPRALARLRSFKRFISGPGWCGSVD